MKTDASRTLFLDPSCDLDVGPYDVVLQTVSFAAAHHADRLALFARWPRGGIAFADSIGALGLARGCLLDLSTFFNAFSSKKWNALTGLESLAFYLRGRGRVRIRVFSVLHTALSREIASQEADLSAKAMTVEIPRIGALSGEILSCEIEALEDEVVLKEASWRTNERPRRPVRLAVIITTFQREEALAKAVESFLSQTMSRSSPENLHLFLVDNGQTVDIVGHPRLTLIRNKNLGGSGGFTRGLLAVQETGSFTHCLFMDDDASCEPEAVWRTMVLLSFMCDERAAVSGAMLLQDLPTVQAEKGAILATNGSAPWYYQALNHYWDLADLGAVANNDDLDSANYGAWWFFAFSLEEVRHLAFPFFVRGDDVDFSLANNLPIVTMNGVAARCASFSTKLVSSTEFLASRAWFALALMHGDQACARNCLRRSLKQAFLFGLRFDYGAMEATLEGLTLVMRGPSAFAAEPAPLQRISAIKAGFTAEVVSDELAEQARWAPRLSRLKARVYGVLVYVTLGGHLALSRRRRHSIIYAREAWDMNATGLLGADIFVFGRQGQARCMRRDRPRMVTAMRGWLSLYFTSKRKLRELQETYKTESAAYRSSSYWRKQFEDSL